MIYCPSLKKEFSNKEDLFKELKENIDTVIDFKKSTIQKSCDKGVSIVCSNNKAIKSLEVDKAIAIDETFYYIVVNATNVLDSHLDLHINGLWNKSIQEQQGRNYLTTDHIMEIGHIAVKKYYVEMLLATVSFASLGFPYPGSTQVLIYKVPKDKVINDDAKKWLESGDPIEASVRMQYVTIEFAMDSNNPEDATEKKRYDDYIGRIANKEDFEYIPYFFIIKEAKNIRESSLVVDGSNRVTGNIFRKKSSVTDENEFKVDPPSAVDDKDKNRPDSEQSKKLTKKSLLI